jgi:hypothetical protein
LWSHALIDLRISEAQFWRLTFRQLAELTGRFNQQRERQETLVGIIAATTANYSMAGTKEWMQPADFVPTLKRATQPEKSDDEIAAEIDRVLGAVAVPARLTEGSNDGS